MAQIKLLDYQKDLPLIQEHFNSLDKESLTQRFNFSVTEFHLKAYYKNFNANDIYVGVIVNKLNDNNNNNPQEFLAGFLHLAITGKKAEIGVSVNKDYQGNKFASAMMVMTLFELQEKILNEKIEIDDVLMYCDSQNKASIALGKKFGLHVVIESCNSSWEIEQTKKFKNFKMTA